MPATIKDIARRLNLSVSTVSYALNDGPKPVSEEVRNEVARVAAELGYRPNRAAKSLVTRRSRAIGVVLPQIERDSLLGSFVQLSLNSIVNQAEEDHYDVMLLTAAERNRSAGLADLLQDSRVDGLILIAPPEDAETFRLLRHHSMPFAVVAGGDDEPGPFFRADDAEGVRHAMEHLWDLGHRRIAHFAGRTSLFDARVRRSTYQTFLGARGESPFPGYVLEGGYVREAGRLLAPLMALPQPPTAVFCANDEMAIGALLAARTLGIRIPQDLSVVGFDDTPVAWSFDPALTSVRQPLEEMTYAAFADVLAQIEGAPASPGRVFPTSLQVRASTAPPTA
ncbi:MAG: LacI family DNA-binding transcriptional regulator [Fimbriimonas sp.]